MYTHCKLRQPPLTGNRAIPARPSQSRCTAARSRRWLSGCPIPECGRTGCWRRRRRPPGGRLSTPTMAALKVSEGMQLPFRRFRPFSSVSGRASASEWANRWEFIRAGMQRSREAHIWEQACTQRVGMRSGALMRRRRREGQHSSELACKQRVR